MWLWLHGRHSTALRTDGTSSVAINGHLVTAKNPFVANRRAEIEPVNYQQVFAALIGAQILHSLEEYTFRLWEQFPPAQFLSGLVSNNLERGFVVINVSVCVVGLACYWWPVRRGWPIAVTVAWAWVALELVNGVGHPVWSLMQKGYTPGLATSLLLLPLALLLARLLVVENDGNT